MIDIKRLQQYYQQDTVFATQHSTERCRQRGIRPRDIRRAVMTGIIIEQYSDDFPFPSCLICGETEGKEILHVVMSDEGTSSRIITAYYPDPNKWENNFKCRKERTE